MEFRINHYRARIILQSLALIAIFVLISMKYLYSPADVYSVETMKYKEVNEVILNYKEFIASNYDFIIESEKLKEDVKQVSKEDVKPTIPKIFYTFWAQGEESVPNIIKKSIISWKVNNPDYSIILVTLSNAQELIKSLGIELPSNFLKISPQYQADWIRLALLSKRGGIWVDASIFMTASVEPLIEIQTVEKTNGFMFYLDG